MQLHAMVPKSRSRAHCNCKQSHTIRGARRRSNIAKAKFNGPSVEEGSGHEGKTTIFS